MKRGKKSRRRTEGDGPENCLIDAEQRVSNPKDDREAAPKGGQKQPLKHLEQSFLFVRLSRRLVVTPAFFLSIRLTVCLFDASTNPKRKKKRKVDLLLCPLLFSLLPFSSTRHAAQTPLAHGLSRTGISTPTTWKAR